MAKLTLKLPKISGKDLKGMNGIEFDEFCEKISKANRKWINNKFPTKQTSWAYVTKKGRIFDSSENPAIPSITQTRENYRFAGELVFLLLRPGCQYLDMVFFLESSEKGEIADIFEMPKKEFQEYINKDTGIVYVNAQSGLVNKIKNIYSTGYLKTLSVLSEEGIRHKEGATTAEISNIGAAGKRIYMASQIQEAVEARGKKVRVSKDSEGPLIRVERLHRFDDPILDIFDTYDISVMGYPLILYGSRERYNPKE